MSDVDQSGCGCCQGIDVSTPAEIKNPPGLPAISYRVGTYAQFKQSMLARLGDADLPGLSRLKTSRNDDFSLALLDAWAVVCDVLTFYQERIANESYRRTATELGSLLELAHMVNYPLHPGVAANTYLAFTLEDAVGAPGYATIDIGTKVQSVPNPGEQPQVFETVELIEAQAKWNAIKPVSRKPQQIFKETLDILLKGVATNLQPGDLLLIVGQVKGDTQTVLRRVKEVKLDNIAQQTHVFFEDYQPPAPPPSPTPIALEEAFQADNRKPPPNELIQRLLRNQTVPQRDLEALAVVQRSSVKDLLATIAAQSSGNTSTTSEQISQVGVLNIPPPSDSAFVNPQIFVLRTRASLFGYNAADWKLLPEKEVRTPYFDTYKQATNTNPDIKSFTDWPFIPLHSPSLDLDRVYPQILKGSWSVIFWPDGPPVIARIETIAETGAADYGLNAKVTQLKLSTTEKAAPVSMNDIRKSTIYIQSEELFLADVPIDILRTSDDHSIQVYGVYERLSGPKRIVVISGERADTTGTCTSEIAILTEVISKPPDLTTLVLENTLTYSYKPATVTINANVAPATQGETIQDEVLGSGDASVPYQRFTLRQSPLTYVQAATQTGTASTLTVLVDGLPWKEVPTLYGCGPHDHVYVTRLADDGKTTIEFGDGSNGARLPTGNDNVRANYRKGSGQQSLLQPGQLRLLMTRPLGVKAVTNPLAPTGAVDPETINDARRNADNTVLTLGHIVSAADYETFALSYAAVEKAKATIIWPNQRRSVFVTLAGPTTPESPAGTEITPDKDIGLYTKIYTGMRRASDPTIPLTPQSYLIALFRIAASVKIDPDYSQESVLRSVEQALRDAFSFEARSFGQPVTLREVITVIQAVAGVVTVRIDKFYRVPERASQKNSSLEKDAHLDAALPRLMPDGSVSLAELLILDPYHPFESLGVLP